MTGDGGNKYFRQGRRDKVTRCRSDKLALVPDATTDTGHWGFGAKKVAS